MSSKGKRDYSPRFLLIHNPITGILELWLQPFGKNLQPQLMGDNTAETWDIAIPRIINEQLKYYEFARGIYLSDNNDKDMFRRDINE